MSAKHNGQSQIPQTHTRDTRHYFKTFNTKSLLVGELIQVKIELKVEWRVAFKTVKFGPSQPKD